VPPRQERHVRPLLVLFEADSLAPGSHTLSVRQYDQDGNLTSDTWQWNVLSASRIAVEPHTYCWTGFDEYTEPSAFVPETFRRGMALYSSYVADKKNQAAWPNQTALYYRKSQGRTITDPLTGQDVPNPAWQTKPPADTPPIEKPTDKDETLAAIWADRNPHWLNQFNAKVIIGSQGTQPDLEPVTVGWADKASNTYASREGAPFAIPADIDLTLAPGQYGFSESDLLPKWQVYSPGSSEGSFAAKMTAMVNQNVTPCLMLHPPVGVLDNGDGTLSATFGWENLSPWTITAGNGWQAPNNQGAARVDGSRVMDLGGGQVAPQGMPTTFGANSAGTWTYTFPDPGADVPTPVKWNVGNESTGFHVRHAQLLPASSYPNGLNPFFHITPTTTKQSPARPISVGAADPTKNPTNYVTAPVPATGTSGGTVSRSTKYKVTTKIVRPKKGYVKKGKKIHFKSTVRNTGTVDAVNPKLCDRIPKGMKFVSAPGRERFKGHLVCWSTSRQAAGTAVHGGMTLKAKKNTKIGKRTNTATVRAVNASPTRAKSKFHVGTKKQNKKH
jgi:uncharacterized repeat protein (TIGR01451 family)